MLILSRKTGQTILFPDHGISVEILRSTPSSTKVGVNAPTQVRILREELASAADLKKIEDCRNATVDDTPSSTAEAESREKTLCLSSARHQVRNELNSLAMALHLFKGELDAGMLDDADATFERLVQKIESIAQNDLAAKEPVESVEPKPRRRRALLVDDEANEREMLAGFLRLHDFDVTTADDGMEAMRCLKDQSRFDVVLMDMRMPRCDGPTTIEWIRKDTTYDDMAIFGVSGSTAEELRLDQRQTGLNGWFLKPIDPRLLIDALELVSPPKKLQDASFTAV